MKIVYLNTWGGRMTQPLIEFFKNNQDVDVFCLQEVFHSAHGKEVLYRDGTSFNLFEDIKKVIPEYLGFYYPHYGDHWGLACFVRKDLNVMQEGEVFVYKYKGYVPEQAGNTAKNIQYMTFGIEDNQKITIINFHGLWNGQGKGDTDDRMEQSATIIDFLKNIDHPFILGGDFNLSPDTKSLTMFEDFGLRNLIKENGITSTRTSYYQKENKFADYVFVSKGVQVEDFQVLPDEVSDHAPLCVKINA